MSYSKERFDKLFSLINREGKDKLLEYLNENEYFTAPCSSQFHGSKEGGLLDHSVNVADLMLDISDTLNYFDKEMIESIIIVGLFHDIGKSGYFNKANYVPNILKSGKQSDAKPYEVNKELLKIPHEISGIHILSKFIQLTEEEVYAILHHNGAYGTTWYELKSNERPLQMVLHFADMWASRVDEVEAIEVKGTLF
ncbi:HD domain-containing protein [Tissierella carlieri]|jgi:putative nucleotidyltransferase with HDIG domain|uniref:HD domain-containing protein n=1 Tax=Tissierella carlieri TaxID=689904 RepID=UPI001C10D37C|nr:HD domain-containing protein [Tissierella carlieri]MBU5311880.1 HD domain-containing protein [Tissierella carlieri]